jgi:hypothetical protein
MHSSWIGRFFHQAAGPGCAVKLSPVCLSASAPHATGDAIKSTGTSAVTALRWCLGIGDGSPRKQ